MPVIVGLLVALVLLMIFSNRRTRGCRWREYRMSGCDTRRRWRCVACGAEIVTADGRAPRVCHRP